MSSPPAQSPPTSGSGSSVKRRISLSVQQPASKKPKPGVPTRKNSSVHPLRQTSFPPPEAIDVASPSVASIVSTPRPVGADDTATVTGQAGVDDEEDEFRDDYGTETVLANGGAGGFEEDDAEKQKLAILLDAFDSEQNDRYEAFRRSNLNKGMVKKLANQVLSQSVTQNVGTVVCGFSKVFVGEIIELALHIQRSQGCQGPLLPDYLREAWRRYKVEKRGAVGFRGAVGGGSPVGDAGGPGIGAVSGGGVGRLFK